MSQRTYQCYQIFYHSYVSVRFTAFNYHLRKKAELHLERKIFFKGKNKYGKVNFLMHCAQIISDCLTRYGYVL